jgi:hypothetical protein
LGTNSQKVHLLTVALFYEIGIISFDPKKKEVLGNLSRPGTLYTKEPVTTFDHDFWSLGHGKVMTHGVYDSQQNRGYITLGNSKNTSKFACEA